MELIGEYLKSIRIKKKIKLKSVSDELKISVNILQNIERDYFPQYLDSVFLVGHIRSFSKYLNLDHKEIIQNFRIQTSYYETNLNTEVSKPIEINKLFSIPKTLSYFSVIIFARRKHNEPFVCSSRASSNCRVFCCICISAITAYTPNSSSFDLLSSSSHCPIHRLEGIIFLNPPQSLLSKLVLAAINVFWG